MVVFLWPALFGNKNFCELCGVWHQRKIYFLWLCLKLWKMIFCNISIYLMTSSNTESTLDTVVLSNILYFSYISWLKKGFLICFLVNERYQCYLLQTFIANLWIRLYLTINPSKIFKFKVLDSRSSLIAANLGSGQCGNYNFSEKVLKYFL